jgi:hypothetical protein
MLIESYLIYMCVHKLHGNIILRFIQNSDNALWQVSTVSPAPTGMI